MVIPSTGSVILVPFPFSDLTQSKLRPAVVLASADRGDWILCQVTSKPYGDSRAELLNSGDFASGGLRLVSYARPAKLFTAHASLLRPRSVGCINKRSIESATPRSMFSDNLPTCSR